MGEAIFLLMSMLNHYQHFADISNQRAYVLCKCLLCLCIRLHCLVLPCYLMHAKMSGSGSVHVTTLDLDFLVLRCPDRA
jgi:hypothetical protein